MLPNVFGIKGIKNFRVRKTVVIELIPNSNAVLMRTNPFL